MLDEWNLSFKAVINQALFVLNISSTYESTHLGGDWFLIISFQDELIKAITARSARQKFKDTQMTLTVMRLVCENMRKEMSSFCFLNYV